MSFEPEAQDDIPVEYTSGSPEEKMNARLLEVAGIVSVQNSIVISPGFEPKWLKELARKAELNRIHVFGLKKLNILLYLNRRNRSFRQQWLSGRSGYSGTNREAATARANSILKEARLALAELGASDAESYLVMMPLIEAKKDILSRFHRQGRGIKLSISQPGLKIKGRSVVNKKR
ncbi:hypothetical protein NBRC116598_21230 [Pseudophaeobacter arcticus]|uniref:Uncharacterized protein n=1 Tax=Pseudophaeobacter arcticus TaxID=385492 RepID=A0ABQ0ALE9_9RHOB